MNSSKLSTRQFLFNFKSFNQRFLFQRIYEITFLTQDSNNHCSKSVNKLSVFIHLKNKSERQKPLGNMTVSKSAFFSATNSHKWFIQLRNVGRVTRRSKDVVSTILICQLFGKISSKSNQNLIFVA